MAKQKLPKWFNGELYRMGGNVRNPFSGEIYYLNNMELSMYDYTMGCSRLQEWKGLRKGLDWFRQYNAKAYMVLLD